MAVLADDASPFTDGRRERLAVLFDAHAPRLYRLARRLAPSADDALDLVQETFVRAAGALDRVPDGPAAEAWLVRTLVNLQRDHWRRAKVRSRTAAAGKGEAQTPDPERCVVARDLVWRALDALAPRRRAVIVMHELEDVPVASIATLLGVSRVTVRWHLAKGRRELARIIGAHGGMR